MPTYRHRHIVELGERETRMALELAPQACTTTEIAAQWGVTPKRVRQLCQAGRIPGAQKIGRDWVIPADAAVTPGSRGPQRRR